MITEFKLFEDATNEDLVKNDLRIEKMMKSDVWKEIDKESDIYEFFNNHIFLSDYGDNFSTESFTDDFSDSDIKDMFEDEDEDEIKNAINWEYQNSDDEVLYFLQEEGWSTYTDDLMDYFSKTDELKDVWLDKYMSKKLTKKQIITTLKNPWVDGKLDIQIFGDYFYDYFEERQYYEYILFHGYEINIDEEYEEYVRNKNLEKYKI